MRRTPACVLLVALALPSGAAAHGPGPIGTGYIATVDYVQPLVVGLDARVVGGDQLRVRNLTRKPVEILDRDGRPFIRFRPGRVERLAPGAWRRVAAGASYAWHDERVVGQGEPPPASQGEPESAPRFVRSWQVPGRIGGRPFAVRGRLAWIPPPEAGDGTSPVLLVGGALALVALSAGAAYLLGRSRRIS